MGETAQASERLTRRDEIMLYICTYADEGRSHRASTDRAAVRAGVSTVYHHVMKLIIEDGSSRTASSSWWDQVVWSDDTALRQVG